MLNLRLLPTSGHISNRLPSVHTPPTAFLPPYATKPSMEHSLTYGYTRNHHLCCLYALTCSNFRLRTKLATYLTVSAYASLLFKRLNTGRTSYDLHLYNVYCNNLPCYSTSASPNLRLLQRLDNLHRDTSCATLSIKLIPFPISSPYPWRSIPLYTLRLLYLRPKHWPLLL